MFNEDIKPIENVNKTEEKTENFDKFLENIEEVTTEELLKTYQYHTVEYQQLQMGGLIPEDQAFRFAAEWYRESITMINELARREESGQLFEDLTGGDENENKQTV